MLPSSFKFSSAWGMRLMLAFTLLCNFAAAQTSTTSALRLRINEDLQTNTTKQITAAKLRAVLSSSADAIDSAIVATRVALDSVVTTFSLADGIGEYNASTGVAKITETGATSTPTTTPAFANGKYLDVTVAGTQAITGASVSMAVGGKVIVRGSKWAYIPPSDAAFAKAAAIEAKIPVPNVFNVAAGTDLFSLGSTAAKGASSTLGIGEAIAVTPGETIYFFNAGGTRGRVNFYSGPVNTSSYSTNHIAGSQLTSTATDMFTVPAGAIFIVPTYVVADKATTQIRRLAPDGNYVPYGLSQTRNIKITPSDILTGASYRLTTDAEKSLWNGVTRVDSLLKVAPKEFVNYPLTVVSGEYYNKTTGAVTASGAYKRAEITYVPGDVLRVTGNPTGTTSALAVYVNASGGVISSEIPGAASTFPLITDSLLTVPAGTAKILFSGWISGSLSLKKQKLSTLPTQAAVTTLQSTTATQATTLATLNTTVTSIQAGIPYGFAPQNVTTTSPGYYLRTNGNYTANSGWRAIEFIHNTGDQWKVTSTYTGNATSLVLYINASNGVISRQFDGSASILTVTDTLLTVPAGTVKIRFSAYAPNTFIVKKYQALPLSSKLTVDTLRADLTAKTTGYWQGKKIAVYGTSIPDGSQYWDKTATTLGFTLYKRTQGGSRLKIHPTGTGTQVASYYAGDFHIALTRWSETIAEKEWIIANYASIYPFLTDTSDPTTPTPTQMAANDVVYVNGPYGAIGCADFVRRSSFEYNLIGDFLDPSSGHYIGPVDLIGIDAFYNDTPTATEAANIATLNTRDATQPNYSTLWANRSDRKTPFTALNYIMAQVYRYNPTQRVMINGHYTAYDPSKGIALTRAQEETAKFLGIQINKLWEKTGMNDQTVPGSQALWSVTPYSNYTSGQNTAADMTLHQVLVPDRTHPQTDAPNGRRLDKIIQNILTAYLTNLR